MGRKKNNETENELEIVTEKKKEASGKEFDLTKLAAACGGEILKRMDSVRTWVDTGNLALNFSCSGKFFGGGIPIGKLIEIWGNSSSCKTLFALNFLRGVQRLGGIAVFVDVENTINATFAERAAHVDTEGVLVMSVEKVDTLQKAFNQIHVILREINKIYGADKPIVVIYDSIAASASEREFAETEIDMFNTSKEAKKEAGAGADKPGEHAKIIGKELRKLNPVLNKMNASVIFINQIREKIGVLFGSPETKASGGRSLEYYCSLSIKTRAYSKLKDDRDNVKGILVNTDNTKNKCFRPFVGASDMQLLFDAGINPLGGLLDCLYKEYRIDIVKKEKEEKEEGKAAKPKKGKKEEKELSKKTGWWKIRPEYTNGEEVIFQAGAGANVVPAEIVIKYPKLVDAESSEQVEEYLNSFTPGNIDDLEEHEITTGEALDSELVG